MAGKKKKPPTTTLGAAEFKATCLELFDRVRERGIEYIVTKHGEPVARVTPVSTPRASLYGAFAGRIAITGEIVHGGFGDDWDAAR
jgi:prevent-host-death family protein